MRSEVEPKKGGIGRRCFLRFGFVSHYSDNVEMGSWNVERGAGHLGRVQESGQRVQGCDEVGQGPPGTEAGKGCQKQQEGLLQLRQQQKEG